MARFVKIINDGADIVNAPSAIDTPEEHIANPKESTLNEYGYYRLSEVIPEVPEGYRISWGKYEVENNEVVRRYTYKQEIDNFVAPEYEYRIVSDEWVEKEDCFERVVVTKKVVNVGNEDEAAEGYHYEISYEEESDDAITVYWVAVENPPEPEPYVPVYIYSKLKIEVALFQIGKLSKFEEFLTTNSITNELGETRTLKQFYDAANDLSTDNEMYAKYKSDVLAYLEMTEEEGDALLSQCVAAVV